MTQYSHSRLSCFENCPKQFEYRYIQKLEVEGEGIEAFVGKRVHEILERLYHHVGRHARPPSLSQVKERFHQDWKLHWHDKIRIVREENPPAHYLEHGDRCLENYYRSHYPFENGQTVALEHRVSLQLDDAGRYKMGGILDRLTKQAEGCYEIHDYKTGRWLPPRSRLDQDRQLALYQIGIEQSYPDVKQVELIWHYLLFNKTLRSRRTPEQLQTLRSRTIRLIDQIEDTREYPPRPGPLCQWCDYRDICPAGPRRANDRPAADSASEPTGSTAQAESSSPPPTPREGSVQLTLF